MLKLGTQTGSVNNHISSRAILGAPEPEVGMGATLLGWTDRHPATVIEWDGKTLVVQEDNYQRIDDRGMDERQDYTYSPNPNGSKTSFRRDRNGFWKAGAVNPETGRWKQAGSGYGVTVGRREKYHDFSF